MRSILAALAMLGMACGPEANPRIVSSSSSGGVGGTSGQDCIPGASASCVGPAGCLGGQICNAAGSGFGPCDCGWTSGGSSSGGGSTGASGGGSTGGSFDAGLPAGAPCLRPWPDDECAAGLVCQPQPQSWGAFAACEPDAGLCEGSDPNDAGCAPGWSCYGYSGAPAVVPGMCVPFVALGGFCQAIHAPDAISQYPYMIEGGPTLPCAPSAYGQHVCCSPQPGASVYPANCAPAGIWCCGSDGGPCEPCDSVDVCPMTCQQCGA